MKNIFLKVEVKHMWMIKLINYPLVMAGIKPFIPSFCLESEIVGP